MPIISTFIFNSSHRKWLLRVRHKSQGLAKYFMFLNWLFVSQQYSAISDIDWHWYHQLEAIAAGTEKYNGLLNAAQSTHNPKCNTVHRIANNMSMPWRLREKQPGSCEPRSEPAQYVSIHLSSTADPEAACDDNMSAPSYMTDLLPQSHDLESLKVGQLSPLVACSPRLCPCAVLPGALYTGLLPCCPDCAVSCPKRELEDDWCEGNIPECSRVTRNDGFWLGSWSINQDLEHCKSPFDVRISTKSRIPSCGRQSRRW